MCTLRWLTFLAHPVQAAEPFEHETLTVTISSLIEKLYGSDHILSDQSHLACIHLVNRNTNTQQLMATKVQF